MYEENKNVLALDAWLATVGEGITQHSFLHSQLCDVADQSAAAQCTAHSKC